MTITAFSKMVGYALKVCLARILNRRSCFIQKNFLFCFCFFLWEINFSGPAGTNLSRCYYIRFFLKFAWKHVMYGRNEGRRCRDFGGN